MALRRTLTKRLLNRNTDSPSLSNSHIWSPSNQNTTIPPNAAKTNFHRELLTSPESPQTGFFRRFLQKRGMNQSAMLLSVPVGDKLREKLKLLTTSGDRIRLDGLVPPELPRPGGGISVLDAKKILRSWQLEKLRSRLRQIPGNTIAYLEFVQICSDVVGSNYEQGVEFAKMLDDSGNVIVLGNVVFLRPEQVAKSMEKLISETIAIPNDPRKKEFEEMERLKRAIDRKAESQVRGELYCGLGFLVVQTLGFMRLTFWELTWDVMEPICFFVASLHFGLAYGFFLRTSKEPSFQSYFQRRFKVKQDKLMKIYNFDLQKYNQLHKAFYPYMSENFQISDHVEAQEASVFGSIQ